MVELARDEPILIDKRDEVDCYKNHRNVAKKVKVLKSSQRGAWRHKCACCAYELGFEDGQKDAKKRVVDAVVSFLKNL